MNEILSLIKPKERIVIASVMSAFAVLLAVVIGFVSGATAEEHQHRYEYHMEIGEDAQMDLVGFCVDVECEDPDYVGDLTSGVTQKVILMPTCCEVGVIEYSYTHDDGNTYKYMGALPKLPHVYVGSKAVAEDGAVSIAAKCTNKGCTAPETIVTAANDLVLSTVVEATCHSVRVEGYTFILDGVTSSVAVAVEESVPHTLNGVHVTEYELSEGVYKFGTEGIVIPEGQTVGCGQTVEGSYVCEVCEETVSATVGKIDHNYVYAESATINPTIFGNGNAFMRCLNEGCDSSVTVVLPKAEENVNCTLVSTDHIAKLKTLEYLFESEEYGFTVTFRFSVYWEEHTFEYVADMSTAPTVTDKGEAYVHCTYEGCNEHFTFELPTIQLTGDNVNAEVQSEATELCEQIVSYKYTSDEHGITVEMILKVGEVLSHEYHYELERVDGKVVLVGRCDQPECQFPMIVVTDAVIAYERTEATCVAVEYEVWTCTYDGESYIFEEYGDSLVDHVLVYSESETVNPGFENPGVAYVRCTVEGCSHYVEIELPKVEESEQVEITVTVDEENGIKYTDYTYVSEQYGFTVTHRITEDIEHLHNYEYTLGRNADGDFCIIGTCQKDPCKFNSTIYNPIDPTLVTLVLDTSTCYSFGLKTWLYVDAGTLTVYYFEENSTEYKPHSYEVVEDSIVIPQVSEAGGADIKCSVEQCQHSANIILPKVEEGINAELQHIDEMAEIKTLAYRHEATEYGVVIELTVYVVMEHTHLYAYELIMENGEMIFRGTCQKWVVLCNENERVTNEKVQANLSATLATCYAPGKLVWTYERDGETYKYEMTDETQVPHVFEIVQGDTVAPDYENRGTVCVRCSNEGCPYYDEIELPKMEIGVNTEIASEDDFTEIRTMAYTYDLSEYNEAYDLVVELEINEVMEHTHSYTYTFVKEDGVFLLEGVCEKPVDTCTEREISEEVEPTVLEDTSTCQTAGIITWGYEKDGISYTLEEEKAVGDHLLTYREEETIKPDISSVGYAYVRCTTEGCDHFVEIELPKVEEGEYVEVVPDPEGGYIYLHYTYYNEEYDFTVNVSVRVLA